MQIGVTMMRTIFYYLAFFILTLSGVSTCSAQEKNAFARSREAMVESQIISALYCGLYDRGPLTEARGESP